MDKLSALSMFIATAEHGSFSRAAEHLGKTPSALTRRWATWNPNWECACSSAPPGAWR